MMNPVMFVENGFRSLLCISINIVLNVCSNVGIFP